MRVLFFILLSSVCLPFVNAQSASLPIRCWEGGTTHHLVFYITGDGGLNKFSTGLSAFISRKGYRVCALDARSYFWNGKTPQKAAADIAAVIIENLRAQGIHQFSIIGYSFGADVLPFIVNNFPAALRSEMKSVTLLSPSTSTDFQIHVLDMLGAGKKRRMAVLPAINEMLSPKTLTVFGSDEKDFPIGKLTLANNRVLLLPGGHHFEGNTQEVANLIISNF